MRLPTLREAGPTETCRSEHNMLYLPLILLTSRRGAGKPASCLGEQQDTWRFRSETGVSDTFVNTPSHTYSGRVEQPIEGVAKLPLRRPRSTAVDQRRLLSACWLARAVLRSIRATQGAGPSGEHGTGVNQNNTRR